MKLPYLSTAAAILVAVNVASAEPKRSPLAPGINELNYKVLNEFNKKDKDKNIFMSSFSIHAALSMAYNGADGATKAELGKLLGISERVTLERLADTWSELRTDLEKADEKVKLAIANSMWGNADQKVKFFPGFVKINQRAHDAEIRSVNFQDKNFLKEINGWCAEKTNNKITQVLEGPIPKDQLFYLVNAIYFKGDWTKAFDVKLTKEADFHVNAKRTEKAKFMTQGGRFNYYADQKGLYQAVQIPFGKTQRMVMSIVLPKEGTTLLDKVSAEAVTGIKWASQKGTIVLPRFKIEYGNDKVIDILKALGVKISFSDEAQYNRVAQGENAKINKIIHKAIIEVQEEGAEAAAVTVVGGARSTSVDPDIPFNFLANRPFYFEIKDNDSQAILFAGILKEPKDPK